jgi:hypothetical protein
LFSALGAGLIALIASACATGQQYGLPAMNQQVPVTQALVMPPPGGPSVIAVIERRYRNGVAQEIALSTAAQGMGQNTFWVQMTDNPRALTEFEDVLTIRRLDPDRINEEIAERLPYANTKKSLVFVQNAYGPFGYAVGRSAARDLCIYAWQQIDPTNLPLFEVSGTISVRLRMCQTGATEQQLLATMFGYTVAGYYNAGGWNTYNGIPPLMPQLGQLNAPVYPYPQQTFVQPQAPAYSPQAAYPPAMAYPQVAYPQAAPVRASTGPRSAAPAPRRPVAPARARAQEISAPNQPAAGYPTVPPPP